MALNTEFVFSTFYLILFLFRLASTNIEEQVVTSYLVHDTNCIISMPEFALRLQISIDDPITADLFSIFDVVIYNNQDNTFRPLITLINFFFFIGCVW